MAARHHGLIRKYLPKKPDCLFRVNSPSSPATRYEHSNNVLFHVTMWKRSIRLFRRPVVIGPYTLLSKLPIQVTKQSEQSATNQTAAACLPSGS